MDIQDREETELARQRREERMRYEVLDMVCRAARRDPEEEVSCAPFSETIGVWREELFRVLEFLDHAGLVRYCGPGPRVCITPRGIDYLYGKGKASKSVPDEP
jgi:hypothetical protein